MGSRTGWQFAPGKGLLVAAVHGLGLAGVLNVTREPPAVVPGPTIDTTMVLMVEPPRARVKSPASVAEAAPSEPGGFALPVPVIVPTGIPPIADGPPLDPEVIRRALTRAAGPPGPTGSAPGGASLPGADDVDEPAAVLRQPAPRYPRALSVAGVAGRVLLDFVIDTTGHVEPASIRILSSSHPAFEASARETLERSLFRPARHAGRTIRQRALQAIAFRLEP